MKRAPRIQGILDIESPVRSCILVASDHRHLRNRVGEFPFTIRPCSYAANVTSLRRRLSSRLIFLGFALLALSTVIFISRLLGQGVYGEPGYRWDAQLVLEMLSPIFAAGGWWFLCQLDAKDSVQKSLLAKAYLVLGLQFSASCTVQLLQVSSATFASTYIAQFWAATLGSGVGAVGFFLASHAVAKVDFTITDS